MPMTPAQCECVHIHGNGDISHVFFGGTCWNYVNK